MKLRTLVSLLGVLALAACAQTPVSTPDAAGDAALDTMPADVAVLRWSEEDVDHLDGEGRSFRGKILESEETYRLGVRLEPFDDGREEAKWKPGLVTPAPERDKERR